MDCFEALSQNFLGGTEVNHETIPEPKQAFLSNTKLVLYEVSARHSPHAVKDI
jgi:hypothetical protein